MTFTTPILKFNEQGEKTGWTYIEVPLEIAQQLKPNHKKSFRVKGFLDAFAFKQAALLPMGEGDFILPLNAEMRKGFGKRQGAHLKVHLFLDESKLLPSADLMACLENEPAALIFFKTLPPSHQNYFTKWIEAAKTELTKAKRIAQALNAFSKSQGYPEMIRALKAGRER